MSDLSLTSGQLMLKVCFAIVRYRFTLNCVSLISSVALYSKRNLPIFSIYSLNFHYNNTLKNGVYFNFFSALEFDNPTFDELG